MTWSTFRAPLAAALSFLLPGLGQAYNRQYLLAGMFLLPAALVLLLTVTIVNQGTAAAASLVDTRVLVALIVLDLALLGWRLVAIVQAHLVWGWEGFRRWTSWVTVGLVVLTVVMHAFPAWYASAGISTLTAISRGGPIGNGGPGFHDVLSGGPSQTPAPVVPDRLKSRFTVLLVGIDYIPSRAATYLTDTMIVATIDPRTGIDLISVPRDTYGAHLGDGRIYNAKLNGLLARAQREPGNYPLGGAETLKAAVGDLVGLKIDYIAAIQVIGFRDAIDALGGVDITVTRAIRDPTYVDENANRDGFYLDAGQYHMDGHLAVAYVRSRKGAGDSDFTRAARQQQVLVALLKRMTAGNLVMGLPNLLDIVGSSVASDVPIELLPELARALQSGDSSDVGRLVIQYPLAHSDSLTDGTYVLIPDFDAIQAAVRELITFQPGATPEPDL